MTNTDRLLRALFVALAVGLGWGIRGDFGGFDGAMYPAACLGLAFAYVSGQPAMFLRMPVLGALSCVFVGMGGMMSYGVLHGYAKADTVVNYSYGFLTLFMQGGAWGVFGCAILGLVLEERPPRARQWLGLFALVVAGGLAFQYAVVELIGFQVNPPRGNTSVAFTGGAAVLFAWLAWNRFRYGLRGALFGYIGFGLGMSFGRFLGNATYHLPWAVNHWNVMEVSAGFFGGLIFAWGMLGKAAPLPPAGKGVRFRDALCMNLVLVYVPMVHLITRARPDRRLAEWGERLAQYGYEQPEALALQVYAWTAMAASLGIIAAPAWLAMHSRRNFAFTAFPVLALSFIMLLFQNLTALYFHYPPRENYINMHFVFWILFGLMVVYVIARGRHDPIVEPESRMLRVPWKRWSAAALGVYLFIIVASAWVNDEKTMASANMRFPQWSWTDGTPPPR